MRIYAVIIANGVQDDERPSRDHDCPVPVSLYEDGFMPSPERAASLITPRTKSLVLVSPSNPVRSFLTLSHKLRRRAKTGAVYLPALLAEFATRAPASSHSF
jgi:hypothetical protein